MSHKLQTAQKTFVFNLNPANDTDVAENSKIIDIGQCASLVNRYSARQGYEYFVQSIEIGVKGGGAFEAAIFRLPEHWPCINAWEKVMRHWDHQQRDAAEEAGVESTRAEYRDFKIFFDGEHANAGAGANLIPDGYSVTAPATGGYQWNPSQVVLPNGGGPGVTTELYLHMLGPDNAGANPSAGMIQAYAESRSRPFEDDPNVVDVLMGGLLGQMENVGGDMGEIVNNLQDHNRQPPYLIDNDTADEYYPGGSNQGDQGFNYRGSFLDILAVNANQNYNTDSMGGFVAPCGLIKINYNATNVNVSGVPAAGDMPFGIYLKMILAPGHYKGLAARPMKDVN
ncbi:MAG: hypothetical protein [Circular genetic element sp.]|nr:MAG: hypothetical protein [Circular genetic element sp.]